MLSTLKIQVQADIFIRCMGQCARIADTSGGNWQVQVFDKGMTGSGAATHRSNLHWNSIDWFCGCAYHLDKRIIRVGAGRWLSTQEGHLDICEALCVQV